MKLNTRAKEIQQINPGGQVEMEKLRLEHEWRLRRDKEEQEDRT